MQRIPQLHFSAMLGEEPEVQSWRWSSYYALEPCLLNCVQGLTLK
jgi:hypothetical protein